jgi:23S rRNA (pseudouridine1915-N3)-methyltransferase
MMRFRVLVIGKPRDKALVAAIDAYETRAARYWRLEFIELKDEPQRGRSAEAIRRAEGERLLARMQGRTVIACDERGETMTSVDFARRLRELQESASDVEFVIGGAFGLDQSVRDRASKLLSLAPWTLSHELARLVLAEQLYRAGTIVRGEPYHK